MTQIACLLDRFRLVILAAGTAKLLHYYGGLNFLSSILLGAAFTIGGMWLYALKQLATFKPYRLIVGINYEALWEDLSLTPAEGPRFESVILTAISAAVFARSDDRAYSMKLDLYKEIPCGAPTWIGRAGELNNAPTFFLRPAQEGYQFGGCTYRKNGGDCTTHNSPQPCKVSP